MTTACMTHKQRDAEYLKEYLAEVEKKNGEYTLRRKKYILRQLYSYAEEINKSLLDFKAEDYSSLKKRIFLLESFPSKMLSETEVMNFLNSIRIFYEWLEDKGCEVHFPHEEWEIKRILEELKIFRESRKVIRKRYYTHQELIEGYRKELEARYKSITFVSFAIKAVQFFLYFLVTLGKTVYTASVTTIEEYRSYLSKYEYVPSKHYCPRIQIIMLRNVKRFYDWFEARNHVEESIFRQIDLKEYERWIRENAQPENERDEAKGWYDPLLEEFLHYEKYKGYTDKTIKMHKAGCLHLLEYMQKAGVSDIKQTDKSLLREYQVYLSQSKNREDEPLSVNVQVRHIAGIIRFFRYLEKYGILENILSNALEYPKAPRGLSTSGMTNKEVLRMISIIEGEDDFSIRDRAIIELLYTSGLRSNELCKLKLKNIDLIGGMVRVDVPKGGSSYERIVPVGKIACEKIRRYINQVRKKCLPSEYLFVNDRGGSYTPTSIWLIVKKYQKRLNIKDRNIVTHSLRVSCATEMLKRGANIKTVQEQLGHTSIQSTEKYLRLVPTDLKKAHTKYHPRT